MSAGWGRDGNVEHVYIPMCFMHVPHACVRLWSEVVHDSSCALGRECMKTRSFPSVVLKWRFDVACENKPQAGNCSLVSAGWWDDNVEMFIFPCILCVF